MKKRRCKMYKREWQGEGKEKQKKVEEYKELWGRVIDEERKKQWLFEASEHEQGVSKSHSRSEFPMDLRSYCERSEQ